MTELLFEARLNALLKKENPDLTRALMGAFGRALNYLTENVYEDIRSREPNLTDHGPRHVENVLLNVLRLLPGPGSTSDSLSALEMYCLGMFILFHDAGNIEQRRGHERNIGGIFDRAVGDGAGTRREKTLVLRACAAHTGTARDGSRDTLKDLDKEDQFKGQPIRLRELAAVLRFADELAEGPQRTSEYRRNRNQYDPSSRLYHDYASITNVLIDRRNERVCLTYDIPVDKPPKGLDQSEWLMDLMAHVLKRIRKLDQERRYSRYYAPLLAPFKATEVSFNFHCGEQIMEVDGLPSLRLDDLTVPGADAKPIEKEYPKLSPGTLVPMLIDDCQNAKSRTDQ